MSVSLNQPSLAEIPRTDEWNRAAPIINSEKGQKLQKRVWAELAEKLEKIQPGILQNI